MSAKSGKASGIGALFARRMSIIPLRKAAMLKKARKFDNRQGLSGKKSTAEVTGSSSLDTNTTDNGPNKSSHAANGSGSKPSNETEDTGPLLNVAKDNSKSSIEDSPKILPEIKNKKEMKTDLTLPLTPANQTEVKKGTETAILFERRMSFMPRKIQPKPPLPHDPNFFIKTATKSSTNIFDNAPSVNNANSSNAGTSRFNNRALTVCATRNEMEQQGAVKNSESFFTHGSVSNIMFIIVPNKNQIMYKCHIPGCSNEVYTESLMTDHIKKFHSDHLWKSFCFSCVKVCFYPEIEDRALNMLDELNHIKEVHVKDKSYTFSPNSVLITSEQFHNGIKGINLKPWLNVKDTNKSSAATLAMLHEDSLAAYYKCMEHDCIYFTDDPEMFRQHLNLHGSGAKACSYCPCESHSIDNLLDHMQREHKFDVYQCGFCFYRCMSQRNMETHAKEYHRNKTSIVIECMQKGYEEHSNQSFKKIKACENVLEYVKKFDCPCGKEFFVFKKFEMHLKTHGSSGLEHQCKKCHKSVAFKDIIMHYEKCRNLSYVQCIHCDYGCQNFNDISTHLCNKHPSKYPMYCDRYEAKANHDPTTYKCLALKVVEHKHCDNLIIIKPSTEKSSSMIVTNLHYSYAGRGNRE